jgi:adenine-specific DNA-methyltransferase
MTTYEGRLELTWTNKPLALLAHEDGSYEWVSPADYRVAEVRLLNGVTTLGEVGRVRAADNLLICGDALNALTSLSRLPEFAREYLGRVKLAYLDPPFNTQQSFLQYDDALEHSVWLTMMRDRLTQVQALLSEDGSVWVHCDDSEQHRLRVLMDEIFGTDCFVATVVWEKADSPRNSARQFSTDQDYIVVYAASPEWKPERLPRTEESDAIYSNPDDDPEGPWIPGDPFANKPYSKGLYEITGPTGRTFKPPPGRYWRISEENFKRLDSEGRIWWGPNGDARPSIKRYLSEVADLVPRTLWLHNAVGSNRTSKNEIRALFQGEASFASPKPEALMQRVLQIATKPGEIVLDCFLGSGTTAAVAQKMGRRWVGIERSAETVQAYAQPRLEKVVRSEAPGGITEAVGWQGGGGFRVLEVASSMFEADDGMVFLADWMTNGALAEATAAQLGFAYEDDAPFAGRKGRSRLAVVDGVVNEQVVRLLATALPEGERVVVCGTGIDTEARPVLRELRPGSTLRKIPAALLDKYRSASQLSLIPTNAAQQTNGTANTAPNGTPTSKQNATPNGDASPAPAGG